MAYKERYGLEPLDIRRLKRMWNEKIVHDTTWECFDDFVLWGSYFGYAKGLELLKRNQREPHGPENSYFWVAGDPQTEVEEEPTESRYCNGCTKNCANSMGCADWKNWFVKNWNEKISRSPKLKKERPVRVTWKYEHPDLIREGLV